MKSYEIFLHDLNSSRFNVDFPDTVPNGRGLAGGFGELRTARLGSRNFRTLLQPETGRLDF